MSDINHLELCRQVSIEDIDKVALIDVEDLQIDTSLPPHERAKNLLEQLENPYIYKCGNVAVKVEFDNEKIPLQRRLITYIASKKIV